MGFGGKKGDLNQDKIERKIQFRLLSSEETAGSMNAGGVAYAKNNQRPHIWGKGVRSPCGGGGGGWVGGGGGGGGMFQKKKWGSPIEGDPTGGISEDSFYYLRDRSKRGKQTK